MGDDELTRSISGILREGRRHVRLLAIASNGGSYASAQLSAPTYIALMCIVAPEPIPDTPSFTRLRLSLSGFEEWLGLSNLTLNPTRRGLTAKYQRPKIQTYRLSGGRLSIVRDVHTTRGYSESAIVIEEKAWIDFWPATPSCPEEMRLLTSSLEDFLILLTDAERALDWPQVQIAGTDKLARLYFMRNGRPDRKVRRSDCWVRFPAIATEFGALVETWLGKRDQFGPAFHLYLGHRRGARLYEEHRFINLIWGLESFHRLTAHPPSSKNRREKIARILGCVNAKDRRWLTEQLKSVGAPTLANRLYELFAALPVEFDPKSLTAFVTDCADKRNDLSHFGGERDPGAYATLIPRLDKLSSALDPLYHAVILQEIGVPDEILGRILHDAASFWWIRSRLEEVGLILKRKPDEPG